jgi:hypothetical protein
MLRSGLARWRFGRRRRRGRLPGDRLGGAGVAGLAAAERGFEPLRHLGEVLVGIGGVRIGRSNRRRRRCAAGAFGLRLARAQRFTLAHRTRAWCRRRRRLRRRLPRQFRGEAGEWIDGRTRLGPRRACRRRFGLGMPLDRLIGDRLLTRTRRRRRGRRRLGMRLQRPHVAFTKWHGARQRIGRRGRRPRRCDVTRSGGDPHDVRFDHDVGRAADHDEVLDVVAADEDKPAAAIHGGRIDHREPRLASTRGGGAQPVGAETADQIRGTADEAEHDDEREEKAHGERHFRAK